jgi:hypothetical protein
MTPLRSLSTGNRQPAIGNRQPATGKRALGQSCALQSTGETSMAANFEITCPCCDSLIVIDRVTGEVLLHKEKEKPREFSFESAVSNLEAQKSDAARRFEKNLESQKDRSRILEEKFKEAMQRAEKSDKPHINPMDLD